MPSTSHIFTDSILSRSMFTADVHGDISLLGVSEIQTRLNSLHSPIAVNNTTLSGDIESKIAAVNARIDTLSAQITSLSTRIDRKQDAGNYLKRQVPYAFSVKSGGPQGDNKWYSIHYWNRKREQPAWVVDGHSWGCGNGDKDSAGHRCVLIG